jgi:hypothetical protein
MKVYCIYVASKSEEDQLAHIVSTEKYAKDFVAHHNKELQSKGYMGNDTCWWYQKWEVMATIPKFGEMRNSMHPHLTLIKG